MSFKQEFLRELHSGADSKQLLKIIHKHEPAVENLRVTYDALQEIWLEFGFDASDEGGTLRDELEYVMEKVWFQCPEELRTVRVT